MTSLIHPIENAPSPESLVETDSPRTGTILLRSAMMDKELGRYSFLADNPLASFRSRGSHCQLRTNQENISWFGNPWRILDDWMARYELPDETDLPFPLGGCFGYWGYDLKNFVEPKLAPRVWNDLELPDCVVGFYDSLVVWDHCLNRCWIVATGLEEDGARSKKALNRQLDYWRNRIERAARSEETSGTLTPVKCSNVSDAAGVDEPSASLSRGQYLNAVRKAIDYIHAGDIYQVNLARRLSLPARVSGWEQYNRLASASPAPFAAYQHCGDFELISSSPEQFVKIHGAHIQTRPIKGTRPRSADPDRDARFTYELKTSAKETAELVMITDLMRNDLGRICEYGSVRVPELMKLEKYSHVQHLVSTVEGRLREGVTHFQALASAFPGGSITGAPKFRAMQIIDELEPVSRGPYTGCLGYLGFNRQSQLNIAIRTAIHQGPLIHYYAGSGIVADSDPEAEYQETLAKASGFLESLRRPWPVRQKAGVRF